VMLGKPVSGFSTMGKMLTGPVSKGDKLFLLADLSLLVYPRAGLPAMACVRPADTGLRQLALPCDKAADTDKTQLGLDDAVTHDKEAADVAMSRPELLIHACLSSSIASGAVCS